MAEVFDLRTGSRIEAEAGCTMAEESKTVVLSETETKGTVHAHPRRRTGLNRLRALDLRKRFLQSAMHGALWPPPKDLKEIFAGIDQELANGTIALKDLEITGDEWYELCARYQIYSIFISHSHPDLFGGIQVWKSERIPVKNFGEADYESIFEGFSLQIEMTPGLSAERIPSMMVRVFLVDEAAQTAEHLTESAETIENISPPKCNPIQVLLARHLEKAKKLAEIRIRTRAIRPDQKML